MKFLRKNIIILLTSCALFFVPQKSEAFFGSDVVVLVQILSNSIQQLAQLRQIFSTGTDTLGLLRDINHGIRDGLGVIQIIDPKFNPGLYGNLETAERVLAVIKDLYGKIPQTPEARLQQAQDQSISESIAMNGKLFKFADSVDEESQKILNHANVVSPLGAAKLNAQSIGVLIKVTTQVLRTNSMMLKMMSENMALQNRKEKIESAQFKTQYSGLSDALGKLPGKTKLGSLNGGR
jgi:hypothetical protein